MSTRLLFVFRRRWPILVVIPLLAAVAALAFAPSGEVATELRFSAEALVAINSEVASEASVQQAILETEQGAVAAAVAESTGITASEVSRRVSGSFDETAYIVSLEVSGATPDEAEQLAQAVSAAFADDANRDRALERESQVSDAIAAREEALAALTTFLASNAATLASPVVPADVAAERDAFQAEFNAAAARVDAAEATPEPGQVYRVVDVGAGSRSAADTLALPASLPLRVSMGFIVGLAGAIVVIMVLERLNPRIDDSEQAAELIGAPVLAMVPVLNRRRRKAIERVDPEQFQGPFAESFRSMRSHLEFRAHADGLDHRPRIIVTSATPGEGKTTTSAFLALSYAETERPPVVVGADVRRPSIHKFFEIDRIPGLSSRVLAGGDTVALDEIGKLDPMSGITVVPSGPAIDRVTGLLNDLTAVTDACRSSDRVVVVDTAPVMVANDAIDFLVAVDWVVVVVRVGRSTQRSVKQMVKALNLNEAKIVGVALVGSQEASEAKHYYYSYHDAGPSDRRAVTLPGPSAGSADTTVAVTGAFTGSVDPAGDGPSPASAEPDADETPEVGEGSTVMRRAASGRAGIDT
jgi:capsular exopolysaccharide synthesis family protein